MIEPGTKDNSNADTVEYAGKIIIEYESFIRLIIRTQNITNVSEDDLFQDFYIALASKGIPENIQNMKCFLYKSIIYHLCNSRQRLKLYEKKIDNYRKNFTFKDNKTEPTSALLIEEEYNNIFEFIKQNTPKKKYMAITLRYRDGYSISEVADKMGIQYNSVARYISTGLRKVRKCLGVT